MFGQLASSVAGWFSRHPSDGVLVSLHDGELSGRSRARTLSHLEGCSRCRARAAQLEQEWRELVESGASAGTLPALAEDELKAGIQGAIHAWSAENLAPGPLQATPFAQTEAGRQMAAVLGVYLGQRAAESVLRGRGASPSSRQESLDAAESTLAALLGQRSATAIEVRLLRIAGRCAETAVQSSPS